MAGFPFGEPPAPLIPQSRVANLVSDIAGAYDAVRSLAVWLADWNTDATYYTSKAIEHDQTDGLTIKIVAGLSSADYLYPVTVPDTVRKLEITEVNFFPEFPSFGTRSQIKTINFTMNTYGEELAKFTLFLQHIYSVVSSQPSNTGGAVSVLQAAYDDVADPVVLAAYAEAITDLADVGWTVNNDQLSIEPFDSVNTWIRWDALNEHGTFGTDFIGRGLFVNTGVTETNYVLDPAGDIFVIKNAGETYYDPLPLEAYPNSYFDNWTTLGVLHVTTFRGVPYVSSNPF